jgi:iron complex outermembrane receptor protein
MDGLGHWMTGDMTMGHCKRLMAWFVPFLALAMPAVAQERSDVFVPGEIVVVRGTRDGAPTLGSAVITRDQIWTFDRPDLEQAANLVPGVNSQFDSNGRRNEGDIFLRGFGRWQVPLMIDGVRIYLPADNRLDFSRFLTADVSEIQIRKGYASVIDGPGAMGGLINLVSRKPTQAFEAEFQSTLGFDDRVQTQAWNAYGMLGTRQQDYYLQASAAYVTRDPWNLSSDYVPTPTSMQQGHVRLNSDSEDVRFNFKAGLTPNDTDEYVINYTLNLGEKGGLLNVYNNPQVPANSFWRWPRWDVQTLTAHTHTAIGAASYVNTKLYYTGFDNDLFAYDDITYTTQAAANRFRSYYTDSAHGAKVEAGTELLPQHSLKLALEYRQDAHDEFNDNRPDSATQHTTEPVQHQSQHSFAAALEDTFHAAPDLDLTAGLSYESYGVGASEDFRGTVFTQAGIFSYPKGGAEGFNWQAAGVWRYGESGEFHASVSDRSRFPIFFELYSTRFGTALPNPALGPERATNFELGVKDSLDGVRVEAAVFLSDIRDLIQTVQATGGATPTTQTRNVGNGSYYGLELGLATQLWEILEVGGNYTYIQREITDALQPGLRPTGVPDHKAFLYATWRPLQSLSLTPSLEIAGDRWSDWTTSPAQAVPFIRTGAYELVGFQAEYRVTEGFTLALGARNLLDRNYELSWGYPQQGRNFYLKGRVSL